MHRLVPNWYILESLSGIDALHSGFTIKRAKQLAMRSLLEAQRLNNRKRVRKYGSLLFKLDQLR